MRLGAVLAQRQRLADPRMARAHEAHEVLRVERLLVEAGLEIRNEADREVGASGCEVRSGLVADVLRFEPDAGRGGPRVREQARQDRDVARIGHRDAEAALRGQRFERRIAAGDAGSCRTAMFRDADHCRAQWRALRALRRRRRTLPLSSAER